MLTYRRPYGYEFIFNNETNEVIAKQNGSTLDKRILSNTNEFNKYVRAFTYLHKLFNEGNLCLNSM